MKLKEIFNQYKNVLDFCTKIKSEVIELADNNPNFVYNPERKGACSYFEPAKRFIHEIQQFVITGPECSGCIFGQALQKMGWDAKSEKSTYTISALLEHLMPFSEIDSESQDLIEKFSHVQFFQDNGNSWSVSVQGLKE